MLYTNANSLMSKSADGKFTRNMDNPPGAFTLVGVLIL
jgi:hypothetical protein